MKYTGKCMIKLKDKLHSRTGPKGPGASKGIALHFL